MTEYLSKEEIKKWRSSLEKITLEEYAARLGKVIEEEKQTNDLVDIVLKGQPVLSEEEKTTRTEHISSIAQRAFDREREIGQTPFAIHRKPTLKAQENEQEMDKQIETVLRREEKKIIESKPAQNSISDFENVESEYVFKKALTDREQMVFDFFLKNLGSVVYAKDLAKLLDLPRDYVYKYIKGLRSKIEGDKLQNATAGGYVLTE